MVVLLKTALALCALVVVMLGFVVLRRAPAYRHHIVPVAGLVLLLLAWQWPVSDEVKYDVAVESLLMMKSRGTLAFDAELDVKRVFVTCGGLNVASREGVIEARGIKAQRFSVATIAVGNGGQIELYSLEPSYVAMEAKYESANRDNWELKAAAVSDGLSLQLPIEAGVISLKVRRVTAVGRNVRLTVDGQEVWQGTNESPVMTLEMVGRYPIELQGQRCRDGYFEILLSERRKNLLSLVSPARELRGLELRGVGRGTKWAGENEVALAGKNTIHVESVSELKAIALKGGAAHLTMTADEAGSLIGRAQGHPLWIAVVGVIVLWMNQLVTHGIAVEKKERE